MTGPIQTVDFLPERYRQATTRRRTSYWRLAVTLLFVGVFAAVAFGLHRIQIDVREEHARISLLYTAAKAEEAKLTAKEAEVAELRTYARLLTFLRHPWPRSRIVQELFEPLPDVVTVQHLRITGVPRAARVKGGESVGGTADADVAPSAETDLALLRQAAEAADVVVQLDGMTSEPPALHQYLQRLAAGDLFCSAEVTSIEAIQVDGRATSKFSAQVVVRPGWGLLDGPTPDESPSEPPPPSAAPPSVASSASVEARP